jgi:hypothetical protein
MTGLTHVSDEMTLVGPPDSSPRSAPPHVPYPSPVEYLTRGADPASLAPLRFDSCAARVGDSRMAVRVFDGSGRDGARCRARLTVSQRTLPLVWRLGVVSWWRTGSYDRGLLARARSRLRVACS